MQLGLNIRQQTFITEYIKDLNATQAYIRAGYSQGGAATGASKLLRNPKIAPVIKRELEKRAAESELSAEYVLAELQTTYEAAKNKGQLNAANRSLELLGRHIGMFSERLEVDATDRLTSLLEAIQARPRPGPMLEHQPKQLADTVPQATEQDSEQEPEA